ncbi:uncharacterized protein F4822DRAFT_146740 [Hypoxylon trugodes]|uniref:uncharacterized protein n=1 Tax=Hypoxylon trugodes TaxID=326681 RepID=UPI00219C1451|nr:uncharacterized protein F4822DRAFT_146740 [Hypoxylon trugodes]KAI1392942.1 hypothetical protein F4822DRAFT_146740 [Hypoxylon trugodes]
MDIFNTTVSTGAMVIQFLSACSEFSSDAKSLKARFEWDLRALKEAQQYFSEGNFGSEKQCLQPEDEALLRRTSEYLNKLVDKVYKGLHRIERQNWLQNTINMTTWIARRSQIQEMAREVHEWTERLNLRVLGLPKEVRTPIPTAYCKRRDFIQSTVISSGDRLQEFLALSSRAKLSRANAMLLRNPEELVTQIQAIGDVSYLPPQSGNQQIIFCCRKFSAKSTSEFDTFMSEMGELAAALSCLDPAMDVRILKVNYYLYHPGSSQFLFAQFPPYHVDCIMTLEEFIKHDPFPSTETTLNDRFKVAYKLAEAVFFLHTAGFCHKNITSHSVVILRQFESKSGAKCPPATIDEAYLMGFDLIRGVDAKTYKDGTHNLYKSGLPENVWNFDIFQHPARLQGYNSPRYTKAHDVYSLGVVLLELGFWQPLSSVVNRIDRTNPYSWTQELLRIAPNTRRVMGGRYHRIIEWCLGLPGDCNIENVDLMQEVLDPLEEIMNILS